MTLSNTMRGELCWFYIASYGGKYELAGGVEGIEKLAQKGYVSSSRCKNDPLSSHGAKSCRIILTRMTEKGISEAKKIISSSVEPTAHFLKSFDSYPKKIGDVYRVLLKQWLEACEEGMAFRWMIRNMKAEQGVVLPLPEKVRDSISKLTNFLVEKGLAIYAPIHHNTSGPLDHVLMTCPEIQNRILVRAEDVKTAVLDEYLKYLLDGLSKLRAKFNLLYLFNANGYKVENYRLRWVSNEFGVSTESLLDWLKELEGCGHISTLNKNSINFNRAREVYSSEDLIVATGNPWRSFFNPYDDIEKIETDVKTNIENWFENGVETFTHFEFRTI